MLLLVTAVALFCGVASWSLLNALLISGLVTLLGTFVALIIRKISIIDSLVILCFVGIFFAMLLPVVQHGGPISSTGILAVRVLDAQTNQPIDQADVTLIPNGISVHFVHGTTNQQGECRIAATFFAKVKEVGWGRMQSLLQLAGTEINVSAAGYEPTTVRWEDVSKELVRPVQAPPDPVIEIRLQQKTLP